MTTNTGTPMRDLIAKIGLFLIAIWTLFIIGVMYVLDLAIDFTESLWEKRRQKRKT